MLSYSEKYLSLLLYKPKLNFLLFLFQNNIFEVYFLHSFYYKIFIILNHMTSDGGRTFLYLTVIMFLISNSYFFSSLVVIVGYYFAILINLLQLLTKIIICLF